MLAAKRWALKVQGILSYCLYLPFIPLLPVILLQGKSVKTHTLRLPEAKGQRYSITSGSPSFLHIGESTVAGVGVENFQQGLSANLERELKQPWSWQAFGHNGAAISNINNALIDLELCIRPDLLLITMGVNDTTSLTPLKAWQRSITECVQHISDTSSSLTVCFTQVPPMHAFPALPFPLNRFLGLRAWQLNNALQQLCIKEGWQHLQIEMPLEKQWMAIDGYHPNAEGYQKWAQAIALNLPSK